MTIRILHGGQTGVDRGAHEGARDNGWEIGGFMPKNLSDEHGRIPDEVAQHLTPCEIWGYPARTEWNLERATHLLVVVPDADDPFATRGTKLTLFRARERKIPRQIVEPTSDLSVLANWIAVAIAFQRPTPISLMVAGPRESSWADGRVETASLLRRLKIALEDFDARTSARGARLAKPGPT